MSRTRSRASGNEDASGSGLHGNDNDNLPPPPPPPFTAEQFFAQFLGSQRNMEALQQNMEVALRNIATNTARGRDVRQGNEVN
jgi:hypothetical protein